MLEPISRGAAISSERQDLSAAELVGNVEAQLGRVITDRSESWMN